MVVSVLSEKNMDKEQTFGSVPDTEWTTEERFMPHADPNEEIELPGVFAHNDNKKWENDPYHCITCLDFMEGVFDRLSMYADQNEVSQVMHEYGYYFGPFWHLISKGERLISLSIAESKRTPLTAKIICRRLERINNQVCKYRKRFKYEDI